MNQKYLTFTAVLCVFTCTTISLRAQEPTKAKVSPPFLELKHEQRINAMSIAPDGKALASVTTELQKGKPTNMLRLWDLENGQLKQSWGLGRDVSQAVAFSADGKMLAIGSGKTITLWRSEGQQKKALGTHTENVECLAFSPDGKTLASAGLKRLEEKPVSELFLWDLSTGSKRELPVTVPENVSFVAVQPALAFSADSTRLVAPQSHFSVGIWDVTTTKLKIALGNDTVRGIVTAVAISPDGKVITTGHMGHNLRLWNAETGQQEAVLLDIKQNWSGNGPSGVVNGLVFQPDGKTLISAGANQEGAGGEAELLVWDWPRRQQNRSLLNPPSDAIKLFAASTDGKVVATVDGWTHTIKVWRIHDSS